MEALRLETSGLWEADELRALLESMVNLYNFWAFVQPYKLDRQMLNFWEKREFLKMAQSIFRHRDEPRMIYHKKERRLQIDKISLRSPGKIDLFGIGDIIKEIREWVACLLYKRRQETEIGDLDIEGKKLELEKKEIELLREKLKFLRDVGLSEEELEKLMRLHLKDLRVMEGLVEEQKLLGVGE